MVKAGKSTKLKLKLGVCPIDKVKEF